VGLVVVDNLDEVDALESLAARRQPVLLRIQPGVDPHTLAAISTGQRGSKFGVPLEQVADAVARLRSSPAVDLRGLHLHLGSQMMHLEPFAAAVEVIASLGEFEVYDVGGGLGVRYSRQDDPPSVEQWLDAITTTAGRFLPAGAQLVVEPGRSLVAQSTVSLYRIITVKPGDPSIVAVDGGIADNFEASTYIGTVFEATLASRPGGDVRYDVVGRQCESGDRIAPHVLLDDPRPGDLLVVPVTGAYTHTLANNYNGALRAPVVFCRDGDARAVVRRDTYDDLLARELLEP
jgi:diaminopimelate decarboxylase